MPVGESCTYKVFSKCSWPMLEVNSTEVNLFVTAFKGKNSDSSDSDSSSNFGKGNAEKGKTVAMPDSANRTANCETQIRMYVTITRLMPVTPALYAQSFLAEEARVLLATDPSFKVTITGNMAAFIKAGFAAFVCVLAVLAF